jgi:hypothetical protein
MLKKTFLALSLATGIASCQPVPAAPSYNVSNQAIGVLLMTAGAYAAFTSLYQLSEYWHDFGKFVKTFHTVGAISGVVTIAYGLIKYHTLTNK